MSSSATPAASAVSAWPSYALVAIVLSAAVYAFSPRPLPEFAATRIFADRMIVNGLAQSGSRLIAVGELGRILIADSADGPWHEAAVEPQRESTLTTVSLTGETLFAGGHDGWILRSDDQGEHWKEAFFDSEHPEPVMSISGPYEGKLYAVGGFGLYLSSADGGKTWQRETINEEVAKDLKPKKAAPSADEDPFAAFSEQKESGLAESHLNGLVAAGDGSLVLVGERGIVAQSRDHGASWKRLPSIYTGSFFGILSLPPQGLLVYGMRGNVFHSEDLGKTWQKSEIPEVVSLFGGTVMSNGDIVLAGENSAVLVSSDHAAHFKVVSEGERQRFATVLPLAGGWLAGGEGGLRKVSAAASAGGKP